MRLNIRFIPLLALLFAFLPLRAQVEPELRTTTDMLDVYIKNTGKPEMVTVFDFTTPSRGIFEAKQYLTGKTRGSFIGANQGRTSTYQSIFQPTASPNAADSNKTGLGQNFGVVFAVRYNSATVPAAPVPATALGTSNVEVRMFRWPQATSYSAAVMTQFGGTEIVGVPYQFKPDGTQNLVSWNTAVDGAWSDATSPKVLAGRITHVRFSIKASNALTRIIDLPCPTKLFDSPHAADPQAPRKPLDPSVRNFNRHDGAGITFDPWSDANLLNTTAKNAYSNGPTTHTVIGNFFYPFDYLSWIYGSKEWRNSDSSDWTAAPASTATLYGTSSGYAVAATNETVKTSNSGGVVNATGWNNGLPCVTRYQAIKVTAINVLLNYDGKINWVYRFLAPAYPGGYTDDGEAAEELGTNTSAGSIPSNDSTYNSTKLRFVRKLTSAQLLIGDTSLQKLGPSKWLPTTPNTMDMFDFGAFKNYDPRTPMPWSYAVANTYYRTAIERDPAVFEPPAAGCPGRTYVVLFPIHGMNDSKTSSLDEASANAFIDYFHTGNSGLGKGSKAELPSTYGGSSGAATLAPGTESFNTGMLSSLAAFGTRATNNLAQWGAPWQLNPGVARSSENPGLQTMTVSLGIPGSYKLQSDNNGRNPHEAYFRIAQWADPYRTDLTYGKWRKANGNPDDLSVVDGGKVHYYPSADPTELQKNFDDLVAYIVAGSAALSAPATPSTGARITSQAFFGIFNTSRKPVWSGNLFAVGIRRVIDPVTGSEDFTFYGADGEDTRPYTIDPVTGAITWGISDFDNHHLWSSYDIFGAYLPADIPPLKPVYTKGVNGGPKLWNTRTVYTEGAASDLVSFDKSNASLVTALKTEFSAAGLFALAPAIPAASQDQEVKDFIDFIRGRNFADASNATNRINIMGDIINSAPLAIELSKDRVSGISELAWPGGTDPHARLVLVGTNMGQLHCFAETANMNAAGDAQAKATELWSFIPREAMQTLYFTYRNKDSESLVHRYIMDGDPVLYHNDKAPTGALSGDTRVSAGEDAVIIAGMRKGGRNYYAIAISSEGDSTVSPAKPKLAWKLVPLTSADATIQKMGMSSAIPFSAFVSTASSDKQPVVFISGGYANDEVNARFRAKASPPITAAQGLGKQILALNPVNGAIFRKWDFSDDANLGAIGGGVTPVRIFRTSPLVQRIYWADFNGNVCAINSGDAASASGFRLDNDRIDTWIASPRYIRNASKNGGSQMRFTNRPDAFRLSGNFPAPVDDSSGSSTSKIRPLTVMVSAGAGDRNNPSDRPETYTVGLTTTVANPPTENRMYVWADRQDSSNLGLDSNGILDTALEVIKDNTSGSTNWATSYDTGVDPKAAKITPSDPSYFWANGKLGYYFTLLDGTHPSAVGGVTHDKILVSPLGKEGSLFFSIFNINGNTGFDCSANAFTRTFRECDITRPLALPTQAKVDKTVGDVNDLNRNNDDCNGLAFYFNSLSSQLADTGDRVVQGGAITSNTDTQSFDQQVGQNTPKIDEVKSSSQNRGFRLRAWRVVR
jgi:hypothetical protein